MSDKPIGVFDSGFGGISFLKEAIKILPSEKFIYYGDNANAPYGPKSEKEIQELSLNCADFLFEKDVKAIVIACNTATSASVKIMREKYNVPIISMEPAIKPAIENAQDGDVVVLATTGTISLRRYNALVERIDSDHKVKNVPCQGLVEIIESGNINRQTIFSYLDDLFENYSIEKVDSVVLGCTHYIFLKDIICDYIGLNFTGKRNVYDGNLGTAKQLCRVLNDNNIFTQQSKNDEVEFYSSGGKGDIKMMKRFMEF